MSHTFCTISTASHLHKVYALYDSLVQTSSLTVSFHVLVVDDEPQESWLKKEGLQYVSYQELLQNDTAGKISQKYFELDNLRWSFKPILMAYLLNEFDSTIYLDNDLCFFGDPTFLVKELEINAMLLSPHWRIADPENEQIWLLTNFREGIYNAGFVGASRAALRTLDWWAQACLYACERNFTYGLWDDQKYLDLVPAIQLNTKVLQHKGCNVAGWNIEECSRSIVGDETILKNQWPLVFVHFSNYTLQQLNDGNDPLLIPYLERYVSMLKQYKPDYKWEKEISPPGRVSWYRYLKWRLWNWMDRK